MRGARLKSRESILRGNRLQKAQATGGLSARRNGRVSRKYGQNECAGQRCEEKDGLQTPRCAWNISCALAVRAQDGSQAAVLRYFVQKDSAARRSWNHWEKRLQSVTPRGKATGENDRNMRSKRALGRGAGPRLCTKYPARGVPRAFRQGGERHDKSYEDFRRAGIAGLSER